MKRGEQSFSRFYRVNMYGRKFRQSMPPLVILIPSMLIGLLVVSPVFYLVIRSLGSGSHFWELLLRTRTLEILGRTALLVVSVTLASFIISLPLAWLTVKTDLRFKSFWSIITALPLVIPSYVAGFAIVSALGPQGFFQKFLNNVFAIERFPQIYGFPGALLTITLVSYPYFLLPLQSSLMDMNPSLEEASMSLGQSMSKTFLRITLPQMRPAIASGALLVALYTLSDFGAVSIFRYETFTWAIYLQYQTSFDRMNAAALSMVLVFLASIILFVEMRSRSRAKYHNVSAACMRQPISIKLGLWKWPASLFCFSILSVAMIMPLSVLGYWAFKGIRGGEPLIAVLAPLLHSLYASLTAAFFITLASIPVALLAVRYQSRFSRILEQSTYIGFALPGIVIALSLVFFAANYAILIYQTFALLIFAYLILFLPQSVGSMRSKLMQLNPALEDAARSLGKNPVQVLGKITMPLIRPGIFAAAALVFLTVMKELPATLLLGPIGFRTLATVIWSATSEAFFARAALHAITLILFSSIPMSILVIYGRRNRYE